MTPTAGGGQGERKGYREPTQLHRQLQNIDPGRRQQTARREVGGDDEATDGAPDGGGNARDGLEDRAHRHELSREDEHRANPEEDRDDAPDGRVVAKLEIVTHGAQVVGGRLAPNGGTNPQRQKDLSNCRRPHPPPGGNAPAVAHGGRADRGPGANVGGEHGREDEAWTELPPGDKKIARPAHAAADEQPDQDHPDRVGAEDDEIQVQG